MAILFDLDGTLLDTAPDFINLIARLKKQIGDTTATDPNVIKANISLGLKQILSQALNVTDPSELKKLSQLALDIYYSSRPKAKPFSHIEAMLKSIEERGIPWGIVTNRLEASAHILLDHLGWRQRTNCLVCADTTNNPKPHPEPIIYAIGLLQAEHKDCVFVGDDTIDILAGKEAEVTTIAVQYGYGNAGSTKAPEADYTLPNTHSLLIWVKEWLQNKV